jgi:hypothetical protein
MRLGHRSTAQAKSLKGRTVHSQGDRGSGLAAPESLSTVFPEWVSLFPSHRLTDEWSVISAISKWVTAGKVPTSPFFSLQQGLRGPRFSPHLPQVWQRLVHTWPPRSLLRFLAGAWDGGCSWKGCPGWWAVNCRSYMMEPSGDTQTTISATSLLPYFLILIMVTGSNQQREPCLNLALISIVWSWLRVLISLGLSFPRCQWMETRLSQECMYTYKYPKFSIFELF